MRDCHWRKKATRQCESALAGHMFFGGCSSCNHVRCTKTATSYNYQFPLDHLLLNRAYLSGRLFSKSRSDPGAITDRRRRYDAVQVSPHRGKGLSASRPRPSFETRPARGTPHTMIVVKSDDSRQDPNYCGDMTPAHQETGYRVSAPQSRLNRLSRLWMAIVCWTFLIFDGPGTHTLAAGVLFEDGRPGGHFSRAGLSSGFTEYTRRPKVCSDAQNLPPHEICGSVRSFAVRIDDFGLWQSNLGLRQQVALQQHRSTGYNLESRPLGRTSLVVICRFQQTVRPIGFLWRLVSRRSSLLRRRPTQCRSRHGLCSF